MSETGTLKQGKKPTGFLYMKAHSSHTGNVKGSYTKCKHN